MWGGRKREGKRERAHTGIDTQDFITARPVHALPHPQPQICFLKNGFCLTIDGGIGYILKKTN